MPEVFGQRPRRGRCPVEYRGTFVRSFVHSFVRSFVRLFVRPPLPASGLKSQPQGSNPRLEAQIPASGLKYQPWGSNLSLEAQIPALEL